jgi:hypothetical protein
MTTRDHAAIDGAIDAALLDRVRTSGETVMTRIAIHRADHRRRRPYVTHADRT